MFYFQVANLALFSNITKTRLLFIGRKKVFKRRRILTDTDFSIHEKNQIEHRSELSDLSDDNSAANKTYESCE
ncbi:UNVERIFIED_CONTAM: hypothetical protein NCL1_40355 [Trichonephila clavipes]